MTMPGTTEAGAGDPAQIRLRPVRSADADLYLRLRCDPALMAELGGALPAERVLASLRREVEETEQCRARVVIVEMRDGATWHGAGSITLVPEAPGESEIGWMLLARWQGAGLISAALRKFLAALDRDRFGTVNAYPSITNSESNRLCAARGFTLRGTVEVDFAGSTFSCHHWTW
ncbi:GNAT family N-acetyltransferase [Brachybacterium sp. sponge]|uniref:GNAT family N-acetyltransferase n=1 Tax=Brachybacterium sp. sponge TaxID=1775432 RepID=UPI0007A53B94|nr:GNAT family N-acetyltransferase [Brachybacterium sp. sponge]